MNSTLPAVLSLAASIAIAQGQGRAPETASPPPPPPPPAIYPAPTLPSKTATVYVYDQKAIGASAPSHLISPEQAQSIINRFKEKYQKMGNPRFLLYVNRELIDEKSGLKLSSHKQVVESARNGSEKDTVSDASSGAPPAGQTIVKAEPGHRTDRVSSTNIYSVNESKDVPLADRQTMRDVERLFGRPLRMAGAHLADQRVAAQLISSKAIDTFSFHTDSEQARKDREALSKVADVVLEILVSSHDMSVNDLAGEQRLTAPDIQVTAIRLSDAQILGQATAEDLIGQGISAGKAAQTYGIREITEATALSLMEDMMLE